MTFISLLMYSDPKGNASCDNSEALALNYVFRWGVCKRGTKGHVFNNRTTLSSFLNVSMFSTEVSVIVL